MPRGRLCAVFAIIVQCAAPGSDPDCGDARGAACGPLFMKLAEAASLEGRVADVERYSERAVQLFEAEYPPDDPVLLRPLAFLSAASFESKNLAKSRRVYERLRRIPATKPDERALVHEIAAMLLRADRRLSEAIEEMRAAILDREAAGRANGADQASFYHQIGALYIEQERYPEARDAIGRASAIIAAAPDATPLDRVRLLETAAIIDARQAEWRDSERKLSQALEILDASPALDPSTARGLLSDYAFVLRKLGRGRDARAIDKRLASLAPDPGRAIVDVTQLKR